MTTFTDDGMAWLVDAVDAEDIVVWKADGGQIKGRVLVTFRMLLKRQPGIQTSPQPFLHFMCMLRGPRGSLAFDKAARGRNN